MEMNENEMINIPIGKLVYFIWKKLYFMGYLVENDVLQSLWNGNLPKYFKTLVYTYLKDYIEDNIKCGLIKYFPELIKRGFHHINWDYNLLEICKMGDEIRSKTYTIQNLYTRINYGYDDKYLGKGYFISVFDSRLDCQLDTKVVSTINKEEKICEVNILTTQEIDNKLNNNISYLNIYTGEKGLGYKVSLPTLKIYMMRFGILQEANIQELFKCDDKINNNKYYCLNCGKESIILCPKCNNARYCDSTNNCIMKHWYSHKKVCGVSQKLHNKIARK